MKHLPAINLLLLIAVLIVNSLANALPINGYNTGELSNMYPNLFVPSGVTFAIWGLIYAFTFFWTGYFLVPYKSKREEYSQLKLGWFFAISCLANISWILLWHHLFIGLSVGAMLVLLTSLLMLYIRLRQKNAKYALSIPISVYLGWISVATIANVTTLLVDLGMTGHDQAPIYSAVMITVALVLGLFMLYQHGDIFFAGVLIWAFYGVNTKQGSYAIIHYTTLFAMIALVLFVAFTLYFNNVYKKGHTS